MRRTAIAAMTVMLSGPACGRIGYDFLDGNAAFGSSDTMGRETSDGPEEASKVEGGRADVSGPMTDASSVADGAISDRFTSELCSAGQCKRVFVSSTTTNGGFGGLAMGDQFCQSLADGRGLGGVFKAWLSDNATNADSRLSHSTVPYELLDGTLVAANWSDLIDGNLAHAIDVYETGSPADQALSHVWTSTTRTGRTSSNDCNGWISASAQLAGGIGLLSSTSTTWTAISTDACDRSDVHLYCFEQ